MSSLEAWGLDLEVPAAPAAAPADARRGPGLCYGTGRSAWHKRDVFGEVTLQVFMVWESWPSRTHENSHGMYTFYSPLYIYYIIGMYAYTHYLYDIIESLQNLQKLCTCVHICSLRDSFSEDVFC